jgi:hypothetical protein
VDILLPDREMSAGRWKISRVNNREEEKGGGDHVPVEPGHMPLPLKPGGGGEIPVLEVAVRWKR